MALFRSRREADGGVFVEVGFDLAILYRGSLEGP